jgi:hypothetical protein
VSIFTYTARRELSPGTSNLELVTRDFRLLSRRLTRRAQVRQNTSLSGSVESLLLRSEKLYTCQSQAVEPRSLDEARILEFLASVENGELFTFDRYGTIAVPDNLVSCLMVSKSFAETEQAKKFHRYAFVIRES